MQVLLNLAQFTLANMWRGGWGVDIYQAAWVLLNAMSAIWLISHSVPVV